MNEKPKPYRKKNIKQKKNYKYKKQDPHNKGKQKSLVGDLEDRFNNVFDKAITKLELDLDENKNRHKGKGNPKRPKRRYEGRDMDFYSALKLLNNDFQIFKNNINKKLDIIIALLKEK